jgi:hypothetical protein
VHPLGSLPVARVTEDLADGVANGLRHALTGGYDPTDA